MIMKYSKIKNIGHYFYYVFIYGTIKCNKKNVKLERMEPGPFSKTSE